MIYTFAAGLCTNTLTILPASSQVTRELSSVAVVYFLTLAWLFFGVAILSDAFMAAVENMTAQVRNKKRKDGTTVEVRSLLHPSSS